MLHYIYQQQSHWPAALVILPGVWRHAPELSPLESLFDFYWRTSYKGTPEIPLYSKKCTCILAQLGLLQWCTTWMQVIVSWLETFSYRNHKQNKIKKEGKYIHIAAMNDTRIKWIFLWALLVVKLWGSTCCMLLDGKYFYAFQSWSLNTKECRRPELRQSRTSYSLLLPPLLACEKIQGVLSEIGTALDSLPHYHKRNPP